MFKAFIYGGTLRYARNTNNEDDFLIKVNNFSEKLIARGYNLSEINKITETVSHRERSNLIHKQQEKTESKTPLVFSTTYNPYINQSDLNKSIKQNWSLIRNHETLSGIFPDPPFIAYRKDQNIREKMIRAKLNRSPTDPTSKQLAPPPDYSGFEDPDETLNILISLLEEQVTYTENSTQD